MGLAKYYEDNIEITLERQYLSDYEKRTLVFVEKKILNIITCVQPITSDKQPEKQYNDIILVCKDCGKPFVFTAKAQKKYDEFKWSCPKRCKSCREFRNTKYLMCSSF